MAASSENKTCQFLFKKSVRKGARKRRVTSDNDGSDDEEPESCVVKRDKKLSRNPLKQSTSKKKNVEDVTYSDSDGESSSFAYKSSRTGKCEGSGDQLATATIQIDSDLNTDAQAVFERAQQINKELKGKEDDKIYRGINNYAQYIEKRDTAQGNAASGSVRRGPIRAPANLRATVRWDYAPDICKDFKETGFCGFGDSCKFLHDRSDYKHGWQLEREQEHGSREIDEDDDKYVISDNDDDLPFKCYICRESFKQPVITKCKHYFCEKCALAHHRKSKRCFACGEPTHGVFNPAKDIIARLKMEEATGKIRNEEEEEEDDDNDGD